MYRAVTVVSRNYGENPYSPCMSELIKFMVREWEQDKGDID